MATKQLDKIIKLADGEYEINANHAEAAAKVDNPLKINSVGTSSTTAIEFDGSAAREISVVPASGGAFSGKITATNIEATSGIQTPNTTKPEPAGTDVINYRDVKAFTQKFTGSGWFTWTDHTYTQVETNNITQHLGIVTGLDADLHNQGQSTGGFAMQNYYKKYLPMYIYLATDTGKLYYGTSTSMYCTKLSEGSTELASKLSRIDTIIVDRDDEILVSKAVDAETAELAQQANYAEEASKLTLTLDGEVVEYTAENIAELDAKLQSLEGTVDDIQETNAGLTEDLLDGTIKPDTAVKAEQLATSRSIQVNLASTTDADFNGTTDVQPGVTGTLAVSNGGTGQTNLTNVTVGKADKVKVTLNGSGSYTSITISTSTPSGGVNGDIWIKY